MNNIQEVQKLGQSIWFDNISRSMFTSGSLQKMIDEGLVGMTSNPAIFEKAIAGSKDYDKQLEEVAKTGNAKTVFEALAISDIQHAADLFKPVYDRTKGKDGYVSLEVSPYLAMDTAGTIEEGRRLHKMVARQNVMIKVPATPEGMPAIAALIGDGINVNVTLLFALEAYANAANAYLDGLEAFAKKGGDLSKIASVASFFLSRIDTLVDPKLPKELQGKAAIASAKMAYAHYQELIKSPRWQALAKKGAQPQRLLWASTSTKNPAYSPTLYVDTLIGADTVNTMPGETYEAFKKSGHVAQTIDKDVDKARDELVQLPKAGVDMKQVTAQLLKEAVEKFSQPFDKLLTSVEKKRQQYVALNTQTLSLGAAKEEVEKLAADWMNNGNVRRLWNGDAALWTGADEAKWVGWLTIVEEQKRDVAGLKTIAEDAKGFDFAVVLGMGGSSLCPWVLEQTFGAKKTKLLVLDSTSPRQIEALTKKIKLDKTLFIVSSKSGSTTEPNVLMAHFRDALKNAGVKDPAKHFIAVTDPGSSLEKIAQRDGFLHVAKGVPGIGGRYSALSNFGMVPGAIMGLQLGEFFDDAQTMVDACSAFTPASENPGVWLGLALGTLAKKGKDKVTFATSPKVHALGAWFEQLIAESTGKKGKGIVPVDGETLATPEKYGDDRVFVYLHDDDGKNAALDALEAKGHPTVRIKLHNQTAIAQEFFRWEIATAVAGAVIGINPFDQPDVEAAKVASRRLLEKGVGASDRKPAAENADMQVFGEKDGSVEEILRGHLGSLQAGDYFAVNAFIEMNDDNQRALEALRHNVRDGKRVATTLGFGPRFLHSTGQLHKGGANNGVFLEITADDKTDIPIPGQRAGFQELLQAQALGDEEVLRERKRRVVHVRLKSIDKLAALQKLVSEALK